MTYTLRTRILPHPIDHIARARRTDEEQGDPHYSVTMFTRRRLARPEAVVDRVCAAGGDIVVDLRDNDHANIEIGMTSTEGLADAERWIAETFPTATRIRP